MSWGSRDGVRRQEVGDGKRGAKVDGSVELGLGGSECKKLGAGGN